VHLHRYFRCGAVFRISCLFPNPLRDDIFRVQTGDSSRFPHTNQGYILFVICYVRVLITKKKDHWVRTIAIHCWLVVYYFLFYPQFPPPVVMSEQNPILNSSYEEPEAHYATDPGGSPNYEDIRQGRWIFTPDIQCVPARQQQGSGTIVEKNDLYKRVCRSSCQPCSL